ncbi:MAG: aminodeoxychorismate synthase component I [Methylococcaceae bacterium]|nr:aminodeoxychorismate synthase component I [Methylococcaceae bacterium]
MLREIPYHQDSSLLFEKLIDLPWAVFLDSGFPRSQQGRFDILSANPYRTLTTRGGMTEISELNGIRHSAEDPFMILRAQLLGGRYDATHLPFCGGALGYFGYDLARRLEEIPEIARDSEHIPEMMLGIYDWAIVVDHQASRTWLTQQEHSPETASTCKLVLDRMQNRAFKSSSADEPFRINAKVISNMSRDDYGRAFRRIKRYLLEGDCYQVNLAQRFSAECEGNPWPAYKALRGLNPAPYSAFLNFPGVQVMSSSPERFLRVEGGHVETKPIKGTRPRFADFSKDREQIESLRNSPKDRAENLMIVDLLRNDLGKSCAPGSVKVPELFDIESFATVHHMVSTIQGRLAEGRDCIDLLRGCFPGGSITGAPKIRAMEIIEELEPGRRGIYCGCIGYVGYEGNMDTNIAIRSLVHSGHEIRFWAGGGIVADSREDDEYQECFDKARAILGMLEQLETVDDSPDRIAERDR